MSPEGSLDTMERNPEEVVQLDGEKRRRWRMGAGERRIILIVGDLIAAVSAAFLALYLWAQIDWLGFSPVFVRFRAGWFFFLPLLWLFLMINNYDVIRASSWGETLRGVLFSGIGGVVLYLIVYFTSDPGSLPRRGVLYFLVLVILLALAWRWLYIKIFTAPDFMRRALVIGAGESGATLVNVVRTINPPPFTLVGIIDDDPEKQDMEIDGCRVLGDNVRLLPLIEQEGITDIIVAIIGPMNGEMFQAILEAQEGGALITRMPVSYEELLGRLPINHLESDWLVRSFVDEVRISPLYAMSKRLLDIGGSILGLLGLLVIYPWVALAIMIESGRPVIYIQERLGQGGKQYRVVKFRTMSQDAEADGEAHWAMEGDPRATKVGKFLRRTHLDEFLQFWNVLRGEMSLVGPRPERPILVDELQKQIPFYRARLLAKPGITGWAQINYGKGASVEGSAEKLEYDLYYIKHRSLLMDLWILLRTTGSIIGFRG
ncbi:MAG: exopolysaccharide biosynthesis polyprenyl glycosylphosphotransferase, partial [Anaerolineales bacterium]|nr:exopolysaccharide biosynthesis polyprenyl glycosylphosphotransferase [Anaerolineales bacterium]